MNRTRFYFLFLFCVTIVTPLHAEDKKIKRTVTLTPSEGEAIDIASLDIVKLEDGSFTYSIEMDDSKFGNHFLSMRPFKCFQGPKQMLCHLVYPYEKTTKFSVNDLQDLEYDLLFIHRKKSDYAIDPWNGLYYKISLNDDMKLTGVLKEVDLDILAAPPDEGVTRPITDSELTDADPTTHSYPVLSIH